jgi:archaellum biogenesis ATPase FlaH
MQPDLIRTEIEHYKIKLRAGERGPLLGPRQTGRTTAIMEYAHELVHAGYRVIIVVHQGEVQGESASRGRCSGCETLIELEIHIVVPSPLTEAKLKILRNQNR